jgi:hypothetical protein
MGSSDPVYPPGRRAPLGLRPTGSRRPVRVRAAGPVVQSSQGRGRSCSGGAARPVRRRPWRRLRLLRSRSGPRAATRSGAARPPTDGTRSTARHASARPLRERPDPPLGVPAYRRRRVCGPAPLTHCRTVHVRAGERPHRTGRRVGRWDPGDPFPPTARTSTAERLGTSGGLPGVHGTWSEDPIQPPGALSGAAARQPGREESVGATARRWRSPRR